MSTKHSKELKRKRKRKQTKAETQAKKNYMKKLSADVIDKRTAAILNYAVDQGYKHQEDNVFKVKNKLFYLKRLRVNDAVLMALGEDAKRLNGIYGIEPKTGEGGIVFQVCLSDDTKKIEFECTELDVQELQKKLAAQAEENNIKKEKDEAKV